MSGKRNRNTLILGSKNLNIENWRVYHPDGKHMFTCGEDKIKWYMSRGLGSITGEYEMTFNFIPNGWGYDDDEFGKGMRVNRCVVTGVDYDLQRHHIVPFCYRKYFPEAFKSKSHHDVVLINDIKHADYEKEANKFKDKIAEIYGVRTIGDYNTEYVSKIREQGKKYSELVYNITLLFSKYHVLKYSEKIERLKNISNMTNIDFDFLCSLNYIQLYKLLLKIKEENVKLGNSFRKDKKKYYDHSYYVVQKLDTEEKIEEFVKLWRNHFIEVTNPQFMPQGWSIDFKVKRNI
jgi:hypothetical protein